MFNIPERRKKPRVPCNYQAIVQGTDLHGNMFDDNAELANLSAGGLYMWANRYIELGSKLSVIVLLKSKLNDNKTRRLATKGVVLRIESQTDGKFGVAMMFTYHRFP